MAETHTQRNSDVSLNLYSGHVLTDSYIQTDWQLIKAGGLLPPWATPVLAVSILHVAIAFGSICCSMQSKLSWPKLNPQVQRLRPTPPLPSPNPTTPPNPCVSAQAKRKPALPTNPFDCTFSRSLSVRYT